MVVVDKEEIALFVLFFISIVCSIIFILNVNKKEVQKQEPNYYNYTIDGESYEYATNCYESSGNLICESEEGTILKVDSYIPIYY